MGENCHGKKWLKIKVYIVNHKGGVHDKQSLMIIISSFFILRSSVITIQKVCGTVPGFVQVQRGRRDNTILHHQKRLLSFQNDHLLYFLTIKALWFEEWRRRENR